MKKILKLLSPLLVKVVIRLFQKEVYSHVLDHLHALNVPRQTHFGAHVVDWDYSAIKKFLQFASRSVPMFEKLDWKAALNRAIYEND